GQGSGSVSYALNSDGDPGYTAIIDRLAALNYNGINTTVGHLGAMIGGTEYDWEFPVAMNVDFTATAESGSVFHAWTGPGFTLPLNPLTITVTGADITPPASAPYDPSTIAFS